MRRWKLMYCHPPFPPKPQWRIRIDKNEKHIYIDLGRVRIFRYGKTIPKWSCSNTKTHRGHFWDHYDIDRNKTERAWCPGDFFTVD
jgi:hypothetical protein